MHRPPLPPENIPDTNFCWRLSQPQVHSATGRIMSTKNSNDTIVNRTRDLPACWAVPEPIAPKLTLTFMNTLQYNHNVPLPKLQQ